MREVSEFDHLSVVPLAVVGFANAENAIIAIKRPRSKKA
ncbi:hypothetical protein GLA29479_4882 [Lysobacter antibioticus]|uniref:Uncharacterized protein n=1 Tax=Lysobacter antibioticus TaxID=84531 RepID=A0A0S2E4N7_LYSAN|nr:hypothetical protein GLA29479_4882 [Lysobacter antibioticus]ALN81662.1 hypothetical protein LA76x_3540 [Lysobacter antibioticus]